MDLDRSGYISFNEYVDWLIFQAHAPVEQGPEPSAPPPPEPENKPAEKEEKK